MSMYICKKIINGVDVWMCVFIISNIEDDR